MSRSHNVAHPIHDLLRNRWSPRAFADRSVEPEKLKSILEAARWAPSTSNGQPWSFLVATKDDPTDFEKMLGCLVPANQIWAQMAPVLIVSVTRHTFEHNGKPNRHAFYDVGTAVAMLSIEATALGLYVHQMAGIEPEKVRAAFELPEGFEAVTAIAVGYLGDPSSLPEKLRERELVPSPRKPMSAFVFTGAWGRKRFG